MASEEKVQGEGDYEAAKRFRKRSEEYVANNDIEKAALRAAPQTSEEAEAMKAAEAAGKKRAKGEDPALRQRSAPRVEPSTTGKGSQK